MDYDPFARGSFPVGVRTVQAVDPERGREFRCEIWYPAAGDGSRPDEGPDEQRDAPVRPGEHPLAVYSHHSGGHRRAATFLCTHLASHGYVVAALDHSEVTDPALAHRDGETAVQRAARIEAVIASRVPDVRFLLDHLLDGPGPGPGIDPERIGLVGHSFGGWTVLAAPGPEPRARSVVALAPGGAANPKPGILPLSLDFPWGRPLPVLFLAAELDVPIPLEGLRELFGRAPEPKRMFVLRRADHQHFTDDVEAAHEAVRAMPFPAEAAWIPATMRPASELCPAGQAHDFTRGLTLAHLDASLRDRQAAAALLDGDVAAVLAARGVDAFDCGRPGSVAAPRPPGPPSPTTSV